VVFASAASCCCCGFESHHAMGGAWPRSDGDDAPSGLASILLHRLFFPFELASVVCA